MQVLNQPGFSGGQNFGRPLPQPTAIPAFLPKPAPQLSFFPKNFKKITTNPLKPDSDPMQTPPSDFVPDGDQKSSAKASHLHLPHQKICEKNPDAYCM